MPPCEAAPPLPPLPGRPWVQVQVLALSWELAPAPPLTQVQGPEQWQGLVLERVQPPCVQPLATCFPV